MFELSIPETVVFALIVALHATAAAVAVVQVLRRGRRARWSVVSLIAGAVFLDGVLLALRAASIRAVPLTGLFESLILLALVLGVLYVGLSFVVEQVWFGSMMVWLIFGMVMAAVFVAGPAARPHAVAAMPWSFAHAGAMILAAGSLIFAAAASILYLLSSYRLKHKQIMRVLGRVPNMETLATMNRIGLGLGFVLLTIGLVSGLGRVPLLGTSVVAWLKDGKVICVLAAWSLLGAILIWDRFFLLKAKVRAYATLAAFALILLATVGVTVAGVTRHRFSLRYPPVPEVHTA